MTTRLWCTPEELGDLADSEYAYEACKSASFLLWALSGRKFGGLTVVTEVYRSIPETVDTNRIFRAQTEATLTYDFVTRSPRRASAFRLKGGPVIGIDLVRVGEDRTIVDPDDYYLTEHSTLNFRVPQNQDIEVTYRYGVMPPVAGRMAARTLAIQFALLWSGSEDCELPARVTSVSRQGISFTVLDKQDFIDDLKTGVYAVDLFLKSVNPDKARRKSKVFSPDIRKGERPIARPAVLPASGLDITIPASVGTASITVPLASIDAEFLQTAQGWTPELVVRSYSSKTSLTLSHGVAVSGTNITITLTYAEVTPVIGSVNPGTWDLYIRQNNGSTYLASGNLYVKLSSS